MNTGSDDTLRDEKIVHLLDHTPHVVREVICLRDLTRWWACAPEKLPLADYHCDICKRSGAVIATGQDLGVFEF